MNKKIILGIGILIAIVITFFVLFMPQAKSGEIIKIKEGDEFSIVLGSNPSTGYQWELEFDSDYIQLIDKKYKQHKPMPGSPSEVTFEFLGLKSGKTEISFSYLRPWLKEKEPALEEKVFKIIIK